MAVKSQGTKIYFIDPTASGGAQVIAVDCAISLDGISAPRDQIDVTCLEDDARSFEGGLATPGQVTMGLNFDPKTESHHRLYDLYNDNEKFDIAIGLSDGTDAPTLDTAGEFDIPTTRSFFVLNDVYVADMPISIPLNAVVTSNVSFQQSGKALLFPKQ